MSDTAIANLAPQNFPDALKFCELLAKTEFVPKQFRGRAADILAAIQFGAELGIGPMQSLQNIAVISGRPCVFGDLALALVLNSGKLDFIEETDNGNTAICKVKRKGDKEVHVVSFSMEDAKRAHLTSKEGPWQEYPARMRMFRARGFALRDKFPDVLKGLITREEAQDYPQSVETTAKSTDDKPLNIALDAPQTPAEPRSGPEPLPRTPSDMTTPDERIRLREDLKRVLGTKQAAEEWVQREMKTVGVQDFRSLSLGAYEKIYEALGALDRELNPKGEEPRFVHKEGQDDDIQF